MATTRGSSRLYAGTLWVSVSSRNLRKVLGILTDTADTDACFVYFAIPINRTCDEKVIVMHFFYRESSSLRSMTWKIFTWTLVRFAPGSVVYRATQPKTCKFGRVLVRSKPDWRDQENGGNVRRIQFVERTRKPVWYFPFVPLDVNFLTSDQFLFIPYLRLCQFDMAKMCANFLKIVIKELVSGNSKKKLPEVPFGNFSDKNVT